MGAEWTRLCRATDLTIAEHHVDVELGDDRRHCVSVDDGGDCYLLRAFVVRQAMVSALPDVPVHAWLRNREMQLVGFRIDRQHRLVAEAWVPKMGLTAEEFQLYVRAVAEESDRFEYALTGRDVE